MRRTGKRGRIGRGHWVTLKGAALVEGGRGGRAVCRDGQTGGGGAPEHAWPSHTGHGGAKHD